MAVNCASPWYNLSVLRDCTLEHHYAFQTSITVVCEASRTKIMQTLIPNTWLLPFAQKQYNALNCISTCVPSTLISANFRKHNQTWTNLMSKMKCKTDFWFELTSNRNFILFCSKETTETSRKVVERTAEPRRVRSSDPTPHSRLHETKIETRWWRLKFYTDFAFSSILFHYLVAKIN